MINQIVYAVTIYVAIGVVFGLFFLALRLRQVDQGADGASIWFRLIIFPGLTVFWPVLLLRWIRGTSAPPVERNAHRVTAGSAGGVV